MSSTISAGTTSGTAIAISGDTSGQLVLQTNGSTTAVTISTGQVVTLAQPLPVASGGSGVTTSTGTGAVVLSTSPSLTTPALGTPASGDLKNCAGSVRAWVSFSDTPTILESRNVSSITDNGVGDYTLNFTTALTTANYAVAGSSGSTNTAFQAVCINFGVAAPTTSAVRIQTTNSANVVDRTYNHVLVVV